MSAPQSFSFPVLQLRDLAHALSELGLDTSEAQLAKPEYEHVSRLFEGLVMACVGLSREEMQQPAFSGIDSFEYPELHEESVSALCFQRNLQKLMFASCIGDFSMKDVHSPEPKRLQRQLSAVINFCKYREDKAALWEDLQSQSQATLNARHSREAAYHAKVAELKRLTEEREAQLPHIRELEAETSALDADAAALQEQLEVLQASVRDLKAEGHDLGEKVAAAAGEVARERAECTRLRAQIIESPEALMAALQDSLAAAERERAAAAEAAQRLSELQSREEALAKAERDVRKSTAMVLDAQAEVDKYKEVSAEVKADRKTLAANEERRWTLSSEAEQLKRSVATMGDRLQRLQQQGELKKESAAAALRAVQEELASVEKRNAAAAARVNENDAAARRLQAAIGEIKAGHAAESAKLMRSFDALRETVLDYHTLMAGAMDAPLPPRATAAVA